MNTKDWYVTVYVNMNKGTLENRYPSEPKQGEVWNFKYPLGECNPNLSVKEQIDKFKWSEGELMQYDNKSGWVRADSY
jgi:hypothetical protein